MTAMPSNVFRHTRLSQVNFACTKFETIGESAFSASQLDRRSRLRQLSAAAVKERRSQSGSRPRRRQQRMQPPAKRQRNPTAQLGAWGGPND
eukprot:scaffold17149_cov120-Isochrysis_galbana.AAC.3